MPLKAETVAQAFLGLSINCAKCHNHPLEKWTNDQYYGMANMFSRVRAKGWGGDFRNGDGMRVVYSDTQGELVQPSSGLPQPPRPLDGEALPFEAEEDRRISGCGGKRLLREDGGLGIGAGDRHRRFRRKVCP